MTLWGILDVHSSIRFPFHPKAKEEHEASVTLIREYCQGPNKMCYNLPTGGYDPTKHKDVEACARQELSEEAHLTGGEFVRLIPEEHEGLYEVKWCRNQFTPYLCVSPEEDLNPLPRDREERIEILRVGVGELRSIMRSGEMMLPSLTTSFLALDELRIRGLL